MKPSFRSRITLNCIDIRNIVCILENNICINHHFSILHNLCIETIILYLSTSTILAMNYINVYMYINTYICEIFNSNMLKFQIRKNIFVFSQIIQINYLICK